MKRLILLRHAKSSWDDPVARDFDRPLNRRGQRAALAMGRWMRASGVAFDHVIASPALRVRETLTSLAEGYRAPIAPEWERRIYLASNASLLEIVHEADDAHASLLLVGHNPGMEDLALLLVPDRRGDAERIKIEDKFPTCGLAEIALDAERWEDVRPGKGKLIRFTRPRDLEDGLGPENLRRPASDAL